MGTSLEELKVLQVAEEIADAVWEQVVVWREFPRDTIGKQLARAADSVGANIAECFGRFHYGDKLLYLYYARGSLFETKYWLNRATKRKLIPMEDGKQYAERLTMLARQINSFASNFKTQRQADQPKTRTLREPSASYEIQTTEEIILPLFAEIELEWLQSDSNHNIPIPKGLSVSNLQSLISTKSTRRKK